MGKRALTLCAVDAVIAVGSLAVSLRAGALSSALAPVCFWYVDDGTKYSPGNFILVSSADPAERKLARQYLGILALFIGCFSWVLILDNTHPPEPKASRAEVEAICEKFAYAEVQKNFISKVDGHYSVYVKPSWQVLSANEKKALAAYVAECTLVGSARFLDSRTGKLLARWGSHGYVNNEKTTSTALVK